MNANLKSLLDELDDIIAHHNIVGVQMSFFDNDCIYHKNYGYADAEKLVSMSTNHEFSLCCILKPLFAAATLRFLEHNNISADSNALLPNSKLKTLLPESHWNLRFIDLITHQTGLDDSHLFRLSLAFTDSTTTSSALFYAPMSFHSTPRGLYTYTSLGYMILAWLIEERFGLCWQDLLQSFLFDPFGIRPNKGFEGKVHTLDGTQASILECNEARNHLLGPAGSPEIKLNTKDLSNLVLGILNSDAFDLLFKPYVDIPPHPFKESSLFAWIKFKNGSTGHMGFGPGVQTYLAFDTNQKYGYAMLCNYDGGDDIHFILSELLFGSTPPDHSNYRLSSSDINGQYKNAKGSIDVYVESQKGQLSYTQYDGSAAKCLIFLVDAATNTWQITDPLPDFFVYNLIHIYPMKENLYLANGPFLFAKPIKKV